jgi:hypothetical protein
MEIKIKINLTKIKKRGIERSTNEIKKDRKSKRKTKNKQKKNTILGRVVQNLYNSSPKGKTGIKKRVWKNKKKTTSVRARTHAERPPSSHSALRTYVYL